VNEAREAECEHYKQQIKPIESAWHNARSLGDLGSHCDERCEGDTRASQDALTGEPDHADEQHQRKRPQRLRRTLHQDLRELQRRSMRSASCNVFSKAKALSPREHEQRGWALGHVQHPTSDQCTECGERGRSWRQPRARPARFEAQWQDSTPELAHVHSWLHFADASACAASKAARSCSCWRLHLLRCASSSSAVRDGTRWIHAIMLNSGACAARHVRKAWLRAHALTSAESSTVKNESALVGAAAA